jgi:trigger factor
LEKKQKYLLLSQTEYHADDLAGKAAIFKVTVKEIKEKELPVLDDEFAAEVSEFDTLERISSRC